MLLTVLNFFLSLQSQQIQGELSGSLVSQISAVGGCVGAGNV